RAARNRRPPAGGEPVGPIVGKLGAFCAPPHALGLQSTRNGRILRDAFGDESSSAPICRTIDLRDQAEGGLMSQANPSTPEIYVVDDDAGVRDALSIVLNLEGFHVTQFADGGALLNAAHAATPACI